MSTTPLTDAINALTTYANTVTGQNDPDLSTAVATLASGYGGGGSAPTGFIEETTYTVESDITASNNSVTMLETICPAVADTTDYNAYLFFITNNTKTNKRAIFAMFQRTGTTTQNRLYARSAGSTVAYSNAAFDWWFSAGSIVHILKFNSRLGV